MQDTTIIEGNARTVDGGDLSEVCRAAEATAKRLREQAVYERKQAVQAREKLGALPVAAEQVQRHVGKAADHDATADRIDKAIHRLNAQSYESGMSQ